MQKLVLLYWGCIFLMYLSDVYYPRHYFDERNGREQAVGRTDLFMAAVIAWLTCFSFLRTSYNDTTAYIDMLRHADPLSEVIAEFSFDKIMDNPLSVLYESFSNQYLKNYHLYFFFPALLNAYAAVKLFKRYSINPAFSMLIFFSIGTYIMQIAALKQAIAMFFLLSSIPYAEKKKYGRFYLLVFCAVLFHSHAFIFAMVPFLFGKPWSLRIWCLLAVTLAAMATYDVSFGAVMELAHRVGSQVLENELFDGHQINILRVLIYWVTPLLALAFRKRLFTDSTPTENFFVNMSTVSAFILMIGLVEGANLYGRMAGYFEIGTAVALPWVIRKLFTRESAKLVSILAGLLYFGYFMFEFAVTKDFGNEYAAIGLWEFVRELLQ